MQETLQSHFHQWGGVIFFTVLYAVALLFVPFYRKMNRKPATAYIAFVLAFAIEMHGIPMSMYLISMVIGKSLPEGVLWGHTLFQWIGYIGMYINIGCAIIAMTLIIWGWRSIYHGYWKAEPGKGKLVTTGIYHWIRHPQYTGFLLLTVGMLAEWATLPMLILFPFMVWMYVRLAKKEERDMVQEFGEEYVMYRNRTKMFIPFVV